MCSEPSCPMFVEIRSYDIVRHKLAAFSLSKAFSNRSALIVGEAIDAKVLYLDVDHRLYKLSSSRFRPIGDAIENIFCHLVSIVYHSTHARKSRLKPPWRPVGAIDATP